MTQLFIGHVGELTHSQDPRSAQLWRRRDSAVILGYVTRCVSDSALAGLGCLWDGERGGLARVWPHLLIVCNYLAYLNTPGRAARGQMVA